MLTICRILREERIAREAEERRRREEEARAMAEEQRRRDEAKQLQEEKEAQERAKAELEESIRLQKQVGSWSTQNMSRKRLDLSGGTGRLCHRPRKSNVTDVAVVKVKIK